MTAIKLEERNPFQQDYEKNKNYEATRLHAIDAVHTKRIRDSCTNENATNSTNINRRWDHNRDGRCVRNDFHL